MVTITREWLEKVSLEDDLLNPSAGAFRFEPWSIAEPDPEAVLGKASSVSDNSDTDANVVLISQLKITRTESKTTGEELLI